MILSSFRTSYVNGHTNTEVVER